jgi:hypothetical protein
MKRITLIFIILTWGLVTQAQNHTISGNMRDAKTGEDLIGATVLVKGTTTGTVCNIYGFYSLTLPEGDYVIVFRYIGYENQEINISLNENIKKNIELSPSSTQLKTFEVTAEKEDENITETRIGVEKISMKEIESIPVLFGERDVMKTVQLLPGIKGAGEGNSGFYVRGGGLGQNLILLDEAPVYNPSHLLGFFSVFNSDAIKDVTLYKGAIPAEYGGRASSVMDIRMKDGNSKKFGVSGGIGLISSRLTVESPIVKDKGSFMISGRRTYADMFLKLSSDEALQNTSLYFYDLNMKANYRFGEKDRLYVSGYLGRDNFGFSDSFGIDWGNKTATLRWNHLFSDKLFSNTSLIYSDYSYGFGFGADDEEVRIESFIRDWNLKQDFTLFVNSKNTLKYGINGVHHTFQTGNIEAGENSGFNASTSNQRQALEGAIYLQNDQTINSKLSINYGLRYSVFNQMGNDTAYTFDENGEQLTATGFDDWESMQFYNGFEPRLSIKYQLDSVSSIKTGYSRNYQYLHLLSNSTSGSPTDLWVPSSNNIKPQYADQISIGYFRNFKDNMFEFSVETYYKNMENLIDYKVGADIFLNSTIESELIYGDGYAYGAEFFLKRRRGIFTGWLSYTYSRTFRTFDNVDNGEKYSARQDRIHDISIVAMYDLTEKLKLSANWVFNTGDAVTFPSGQYTVGGVVVPYYTERNGYRMPNYHRMDIGLTWQRKKAEKFESSWNFSIYNLYGRENAYQITFQQNEADPTQTEAIQLSLFKWVPSFSYNFKF